MVAQTAETRIGEEIARAVTWVAEGRIDLAVNAFAQARAMALALAEPAALRAVIARDTAAFSRERDALRIRLQSRAAAGAGGDGLVILADSLALARPGATAGATPETRTYPWLLANGASARNVTALCQRFFTTDHVRDALLAEPGLGAGADVFIHVGLNDCANRMFLEDERQALSLLAEPVRAAIVGFAQRHRRDILRHLPPRHYVGIDRFRANLDRIADLLAGRGARRVVLCTIILPPAKFWPATPGINANFATYNLAIMTAVQRHGLRLLDLDRLIWAALPEAPLIEDGMHLSDLGHRICADALGAVLKG